MSKTIQELENELRVKKLQEYESKRRAELATLDSFREEHDINIYTSDDYCGMSVGNFSFYYGYEVTECPVKSHTKEELCEAYNCDKREWCFTADVDGKEVMRLRASQLWGKEGEEPFFYLLGGIAQFLRKKEQL